MTVSVKLSSNYLFINDFSTCTKYSQHTRLFHTRHNNLHTLIFHSSYYALHINKFQQTKPHILQFSFAPHTTLNKTSTHYFSNSVSKFLLHASNNCLLAYTYPLRATRRKPRNSSKYSIYYSFMFVLTTLCPQALVP